MITAENKLRFYCPPFCTFSKHLADISGIHEHKLAWVLDHLSASTYFLAMRNTGRARSKNHCQLVHAKVLCHLAYMTQQIQWCLKCVWKIWILGRSYSRPQWLDWDRPSHKAGCAHQYSIIMCKLRLFEQNAWVRFLDAICVCLSCCVI